MSGVVFHKGNLVSYYEKGRKDVRERRGKGGWGAYI